MKKTITIGECKVVIQRPTLSPDQRRTAEQSIKVALVNYERKTKNEYFGKN